VMVGIGPSLAGSTGTSKRKGKWIGTRQQTDEEETNLCRHHSLCSTKGCLIWTLPVQPQLPFVQGAHLGQRSGRVRFLSKHPFGGYHWLGCVRDWHWPKITRLGARKKP
jgi:hypothetical protein